VIGLRSALFHAWMFGVIAAFSLVCLPLLLGPRSALPPAQRVLARLLLGGLSGLCGVRVEVRGLEHRPAGGALIASKHQSMLDGIAPLVFLPGATFVLKRELLGFPLMRAYGRKAELISLDREGGAAALKALVADVRDRVAKGRPVIIFPEGTRQAPGAAPDYKPGVAALYRELDGPVTPLATTSGLCWPKGWTIRPGVAIYAFAAPIAPGLKRGAFMAELQTRIETATDALLRQAESR